MIVVCDCGYLTERRNHHDLADHRHSSQSDEEIREEFPLKRKREREREGKGKERRGEK